MTCLTVIDSKISTSESSKIAQIQPKSHTISHSVNRYHGNAGRYYACVLEFPADAFIRSDEPTTNFINRLRRITIGLLTGCMYLRC